MVKPSIAIRRLMAVTIVAVLILPSLALAQGTKQGETRAVLSVDDMQQKLEEVRQVSAKIGSVAEAATKKAKEIAECKDRNQCVAKFEGLFTNMRTEVINVLDKLGSNSELMDAVAQAKTSILVLKKWYKANRPDSPQLAALIQDFDAELTNLDKAVENIREGRVLAQEQLRVIMEKEQTVVDLMLRKQIKAMVETVQAVAGELVNLQKVLEGVANFPISSTVRVVH